MEIVKKYFADFTPQQEQQLTALRDLYSSWNEKINVISRKDMDNFYMHHVLHSLAITTQFNFKKNMQVMDLGCGGGFPGVPLAIFFPDTHFHMVDSINKKLTVINEISGEIGLKNITTNIPGQKILRTGSLTQLFRGQLLLLKICGNGANHSLKKIKINRKMTLTGSFV